ARPACGCRVDDPCDFPKPEMRLDVPQVFLLPEVLTEIGFLSLRHHGLFPLQRLMAETPVRTCRPEASRFHELEQSPVRGAAGGDLTFGRLQELGPPFAGRAPRRLNRALQAIPGALVI